MRFRRWLWILGALLASGIPMTGAEPLRPWRLSVVGDLMVHAPQLKAARNGSAYDFAPVFEAVAARLRAADLTVGNLETTLGGPTTRYTGYPAFNTPDSFAEALRAAGFDLLSTANNHSLDRRGAGLRRTLATLDRLGLRHQGSWTSPADRRAPVTVMIGPVKVTFVAWTYGTNGIPLPGDAPWTLGLLADEQAMDADIEAALRAEPDLVVALVHCGDEYRATPNAKVVALGDRLIARGVDVVLMSHPHVVQPVTIRTVRLPDGSTRRGLVAWSLGNFVSSQRKAPRDWGVILQLDLRRLSRGVVVTASAAPTWVQFRPVGGGRLARPLIVGEVLSAEGPKSLWPGERPRLRAVWKESTAVLLGRSGAPASATGDFPLNVPPLLVLFHEPPRPTRH